MKGIARYFVAAVALALIGCMCLAVGLLDRGMARAQQNFSTLNYAATEAGFETAERYLEYGSRIPWINTGVLNDVRARKAAVQYWQQRYTTIVPQQADPVSAVAADNIALQLVVANAVYRNAQADAKDRQTTLQATDAGINAYLIVLKNATRQEDAAYNYEYLVRLRDEVDKSRRKPVPPGAEPAGPLGQGGTTPTAEGGMRQFKVYVPLELQERIDAGAAGKASPMKRKG